ncbi:putative amidase C869.01 [Phalaenopsis equestris]|uniref:putative amidase C869.01 n=1 Tax=Phalaenopsis equestris TaxID=78828 RepID=UPI0009E5F8B1|nr:putative amidase C869.01 [Phalaenopsis equestris]
MASFVFHLLLLLLLLPPFLTLSFDFDEATILDIQSAFNDGNLTSLQLVQHYLDQINVFNPQLRAVLEVNPDALAAATLADEQRKNANFLGPLHGIPVLLKDSIATRDRLNTTACSFALLGSVVPRDAGVVDRLRRGGAIILGKATMSEWANSRSFNCPNGWCARSGQAQNPYTPTEGPCGSSSGPAIAVAANLAAVSIGTETVGSILCPAAKNSVVGIKPSVGLTSRAGVVPISPLLDTVGPMGRTVTDAVMLLDAIVGFDPLDAAATSAAAQFIPSGGFRRFLNVDGLKGKRVGIFATYFNFAEGSVESSAFAAHFEAMRQKGATVVENLRLPNVKFMLQELEDGQATQLLASFKVSINAYLANLVYSPVRSLRDIIDFNNNHTIQERMKDFGQDIFLAAEQTNGLGEEQETAGKKIDQLSKDGLEKLMKDRRLDAIVFPDALASNFVAIGGFPAISVPAGYSSSGVPFGICFSGLKGSDQKLIEIAYAFEQATKVRKPPILTA